MSIRKLQKSILKNQKRIKTQNMDNVKIQIIKKW